VVDRLWVIDDGLVLIFVVVVVDFVNLFGVVLFWFE